MSLKPYPKYKDIGVEWLGEVPEHWVIQRLESIVDTDKTIVLAEELNGQEVFHYSIPVVQNTGDGQLEDGGDIDSSKFIVSEPQVLISKLNPRKATVCVAKPHSRMTISSTEFVSIIPRKIDLRFAYYAVLSEQFRQRLEALVESATRSHQRVAPADILKAVWAFPSKEEQRKIVLFLDRETAKIDTLITEQEKLISLLAEKRQATISHAVTKGLNPNVKMKDSGVEWLGEVPEHWEVVPVGYRYSVQLGKMLDTAKITGTHLRPYLRVFDVQWREINIDDLPSMDFDEEAQSRFRLEAGDLIVNEGGSYVGRSAIWRGELAECYYQKALHRLRPLDVNRDTADFMLNIMEFATKYGVFVAGGNQTTIDHLTAEQFRQYRFAYPPLPEQREISAHLEDAIADFNTLSFETERAIDLLKERRTALISAAVTGKIDVREVASKEASKEMVAA